jgi:hypothetical protein
MKCWAPVPRRFATPSGHEANEAIPQVRDDERVLLIIRKMAQVNTFLGGTSHHLTKKALQRAGLSFKNITVSLIS